MRKDASCLSSGDDITVSSPSPFWWRIYEFGKLYDENETTSFALAGDTPNHDNIARERMVNELAEAMINDVFMAINYNFYMTKLFVPIVICTVGN